MSKVAGAHPAVNHSLRDAEMFSNLGNGAAVQKNHQSGNRNHHQSIIIIGLSLMSVATILYASP